MEENLNKLERQEQDTLERWRIRSERAGLALDKLEGQITVIDDPIGNNLETIRRQEDAFEVQLRIGCYIRLFFLLTKFLISRLTRQKKKIPANFDYKNKIISHCSKIHFTPYVHPWHTVVNGPISAVANFKIYTAFASIHKVFLNPIPFNNIILDLRSSLLFKARFILSFRCGTLRL